MLTQNAFQRPNLQNYGSSYDIVARKSQSKGKGLFQILQRLRKNSQELINSQTKLLKLKRRRADTEQKRVYYKDIQQQVMKPGVAVLRIFSQSKPLNIGDFFLDAKQKAKIIYSDRIYTKMPNVVSGICKKRVQTDTQDQKRQWISRKFSDYDRIVTQQTGPLRILTKKRSEAYNGIKKKHQINIGKNPNIKQLFSVFEKSNNNFYTTNDIKQLTSTKFTNTNSTSIKQKTRQGTFQSESTLNSKVIFKQKVKKMSQNLFMDMKNRSKRIQTNFE